jgi:DNA-binding IclR family transcriptional regulator
VGTSFTLRRRTSRVAWSRPHLADLVQATGETANMAMLDGTMAVYVAQALRVKMSRFGHYGAYAAGALSRSGLHFRPMRSDSGAGQCGPKPGDQSIENLDQLG